MEAMPLRHVPAFEPRAAADEWDWLYDDPDLQPYLAAKRRGRKETPLTAFG